MPESSSPLHGQRDRFYCAFCGLRGKREVEAFCPRRDACAARPYGQKKEAHDAR